jgi:hypothetical protein
MIGYGHRSVTQRLPTPEELETTKEAWASSRPPLAAFVE